MSKSSQRLIEPQDYQKFISTNMMLGDDDALISRKYIRVLFYFCFCKTDLEFIALNVAVELVYLWTENATAVVMDGHSVTVYKTIFRALSTRNGHIILRRIVRNMWSILIN